MGWVPLVLVVVTVIGGHEGACSLEVHGKVVIPPRKDCPVFGSAKMPVPGMTYGQSGS